MDFLDALRAKLDDFGVLLATADEKDLAAPVPSCGSWTLYDLADHLGRGNTWVATAVAENRGDHYGDHAPTGPSELRSWFAARTDEIVLALSADPETPVWTFTEAMPQNIGFWRRRRAQETAMHLWDARNALGRAEPFDIALAVDGVTEVFELFAPRMIFRGLAEEPGAAIRVTATDAARSWIHGPGEPVAEVSGTASDLLLLLWARKTSSDREIDWLGDREAGIRVLAGPLVP